MSKDPHSPTCRTISTLLSRIGDKWTVLVVSTLGEGSRRFNELRREIPSVSQRMLTLTLRNLERDGLVQPAGERRDGRIGKPATIYTVSPDADMLFSKAYIPLLTALLAVLGKRLTPEELAGKRLVSVV